MVETLRELSAAMVTEDSPVMSGNCWCMEALREALEQILKDFGSEYQITFA
jgi:hypothetical protein